MDWVDPRQENVVERSPKKVVLRFTVIGRTLAELEEAASQELAQFFGSNRAGRVDYSLDVNEAEAARDLNDHRQRTILTYEADVLAYVDMATLRRRTERSDAL